MDVSIDQRWKGFVDDVVRQGRYGSADEVVVEGLRLVKEQERKLQALRDTLERSIAEGGENTDEDISQMIEEAARRFESQR